MNEKIPNDWPALEDVDFEQLLKVDLWSAEPQSECEAFLLSIAKWHPSRPLLERGEGGDLTCGLCVYYDVCEECAFNLTLPRGCCNPNHIWYKWSERERAFIKNYKLSINLQWAAHRVYAALIETYNHVRKERKCKSE